MEKRIKEKVEVIIDRVEFIKENISEDFISNRILRKAIYKEFQEAVEAAMDICAMLRRKLNSSAQDDYSNIDYLHEKGVINSELKDKLKEANGLRNRLIHGYDRLEDEIACNSIKNLLDYLLKFSEVILDWISKY